MRRHSLISRHLRFGKLVSAERPQMKPKSVGCAASILACLGMVVVPWAAHAQPAYQPGVGFPIIGVATGQSVRVNALNMGSSSSTEDSSCTVTVQFLDMQGQQLKQTVVSLGAG